jgi:large subunit ribosomal protein L21
MKYAIIQSGNKQFIVKEGEDVMVERLKIKEDKMVFDKVLLLRDNKEILIGQPYLDNVLVKAKILGEEKGDKIFVMKFKAKVHYRRRIGFRPKYTKIHIDAIEKKTKADKKN